MLTHILLVLLGVWLVHAENYNVKITYDEHHLNLLLPVLDIDVSSVLFHFGLRNYPRTGRAVRLGDGWGYHTDFVAYVGDVIYAYADVQYKSGLLVTTPHINHIVNGGAVTFRPPNVRKVRAVTFRDDFNSFNRNNWSPEVSMFGGFNWEFQVYTNDNKNVYARNGNIYLHPTQTVSDPRFNENFLHHGHMDMVALFGVCTQSGNYGCTRDGANGMLPPIMSGKVSSHPTLRFGTAEIRAKIPRGNWLWPAIWMMPKTSHYGAWPRSGEIDIMESRGNPGNVGVGTVSSTLHWGPSAGENKFSLTHGERHSAGYHAAFHTWRLDWTQTHIKTFVDNEQILDVEVGNGFWAKGGFSGANPWAGGSKAAPFDQEFFIMLNVAVGGTNGYFPDNINYGSKKPWANTSPHAAEDFWNGRSEWLPTWNGDEAALIVDYVEFRN